MKSISRFVFIASCSAFVLGCSGLESDVPDNNDSFESGNAVVPSYEYVDDSDLFYIPLDQRNNVILTSSSQTVFPNSGAFNRLVGDLAEINIDGGIYYFDSDLSDDVVTRSSIGVVIESSNDLITNPLTLLTDVESKIQGSVIGFDQFSAISISTLRVDPNDPNSGWVAALGKYRVQLNRDYIVSELVTNTISSIVPGSHQPLLATQSEARGKAWTLYITIKKALAGSLIINAAYVMDSDPNDLAIQTITDGTNTF